jgi:serine/threonine-protein kinase
MELVEGEGLDEVISRGPVPVEDAIPIARQIAEALEAAHEAGIVHRDLKPANVRIRPDGTVKVLDFGLAKAWGERDATDLSISPTLTARHTRAGVILGTAAYMSPEQAKGKPVDRRADIWAFGVVLWEMLTGRKLFDGETVTEVLASVLKEAPDLDVLPAEVPGPLRRLVERCLERDPRQRLQAVGEARIGLEAWRAGPDAARAGSGASPVVETTTRSSRRSIAVVLVAMVLSALATVIVVRLTAPAPQTDALHYSIHPIDSVIAAKEGSNGIDISRDGSAVVFVGSGMDSATMLYVKTSDIAEPRPIAGTEGASGPFFSPDGQWVGFFTDTELRKVSLRGGNPVTLAQTAARRGGLWHPDGSIYFVPTSNSPVLRMPAAGGEIVPVTVLDVGRRERTHRWPSLVPGGKAILYTSDTFESTEYYDDARIEAVDLETGTRKTVLEGSSRAVATVNGYLLFARDGSLFAAPFDLDDLEVTGSPFLVVQNVVTVVSSGYVQFAISDSGTLCYVPGDKTWELFDLVWVTRGGETQATSLERGTFSQVALSPEGDRAAIVNTTEDSRDLWLLDMERQTFNRLTFDGTNSQPVWDPDGEHVIFASNRDGSYTKPYRQSADGIGAPDLLWDAPGEAYPMDITRDGRFLAVALNPFTMDDNAGTEIWIVDHTGDRDPFPFFENQVNCGNASFSPDQRWLAYISMESGQARVYVRPFPAADGKWEISQNWSREPRWSPDGRRLYYRTLTGTVSVPIDTSRGFAAGRPEIFYRSVLGPPLNMTYSVAAEGDRLLSLRPHDEDATSWTIHVILGWQKRLDQR